MRAVVVRASSIFAHPHRSLLVTEYDHEAKRDELNQQADKLTKTARSLLAKAATLRAQAEALPPNDDHIINALPAPRS